MIFPQRHPLLNGVVAENALARLGVSLTSKRTGKSNLEQDAPGNGRFILKTTKKHVKFYWSQGSLDRPQSDTESCAGSSYN